MYFFGPVAPSQTVLNSTIQTSTTTGGIVDITSYGSAANIATNAGMTFFAGPRDDPFFMDFARFTQILTPGDDDGDGEEEAGFLPEGSASDTFAENTLSGRALADDVITVELLLIFGGEDFMENPSFSSLGPNLPLEHSGNSYVLDFFTYTKKLKHTQS